MRRIQFPRRGTPRTGPVSARNLLAKKKATLRFLHVHHDDLKHAIRLAGRNHHNAQETWQRVFRDAERAVLRKVAAAFPELESVSPTARDFILWHRKGRFELGRTVRLPGAVSGLFADQDGLYGSACTQYRDSMNDVADWAKEHDLMDHTGGECVPRQVSLLEAHVNQPARVALLQHHDGYGPRLEVGAELPETYQRPIAEIETLVAEVPILAVLEPAERSELARAARPLTLAPTERLVVQGEEGGSLFILADGEVEVFLRGDDGEDVLVDTMGEGRLRRRDVAAHRRAPDGHGARPGRSRRLRDRIPAVRAAPARPPGAGRRARAAHGRPAARAPPAARRPGGRARARHHRPPDPPRALQELTLSGGRRGRAGTRAGGRPRRWSGSRTRRSRPTAACSSSRRSPSDSASVTVGP